MFRRHLNFSSHLHGNTASLRYIACFSSSKTWCTPCSSVSAADVGWDRRLPLFRRGETHRSTTLSASSFSPTSLPTALCSARRWYVYQPPGTREPNMPWFRSGASSSASTAVSRHPSPGSKSSPSKSASPLASSKPIPPPSPSHHASNDAAAVGGEESLRYTASPTRGKPSGSVPPSVGTASLTSSGASSASTTAFPSRGGAGDVFSPSGQNTPRAAASPMSSTSSLWGTGASLAPAPPPPPSSSTSHPSSSFSLRDAGMSGGVAPQVPPSSPRVASPIPVSPPVAPLWTGPLDLRTPLEYILQRHDREHGERSDRKDGEDERNHGKSGSVDPSDPQRKSPAAADTMLHDLAALLIDPVAQNTVERIALRTFASMQPKRQLLALQGNKEWWEWIVASAPYREVVDKMRHPQHTAAAETTLKQDRRVLKEAGLRTLQDWVEHQHLVTMSPQTKSALDAAVTITVQQHVSQVLSVVKQCHSVRHLLRRWLSDVVGKFILDSLALSVEAAAVSVQKARGARWSTRKGLFAPPSSAEKADMDEYAAVEEDEAMSEEDTAMAVMMMKGTGSSSSSSSSAMGGAAKSPLSPAKKHSKKPTDKRADPSRQTASPLRAGEVCTVEHYLMFLQKVTASVRQDRWKHENSSRSPVANRNAGRDGNMGNANTVDTASATETSQDECEVQERTKSIVASAFSHLLQHAMQLYLPAELRELADGGYLALERVPVLLQRAASQLQLRTLPVGYFILHSTTQEKKKASSAYRRGGGGGGRTVEGGQGNENAFFPPALPLFPEGTDDVITDVVHPLTESVSSVGTHDFAREETGETTLPGAFLTDEEDPSIPLMIWKRPRRALRSGRGGGNGTSPAPPHTYRTPGTPYSPTHAHTSGRATLYDGESLQESYYSMLFHLQSALEKLSFTTIEELFDDADSLSGCPQSTVWNASSDKSVESSPLAWSSVPSSSGGVCCSSSLLSAIFGDDPLFGPAKLVEDQLTTAVSVPPSASSVEKPPLYFVEAGANCGKTALLERLQQRLRPQEVIRSPSTGSGNGGGRFHLSSVSLPGSSPSRGGAVLIRYQSATTPFIPDLDDHPMAFAARFWFRVVLSTMPYFTRSELLFSRAPTSSPLWWSNQPHQLHWSYHTIAQSGAIPRNSMPSSVLVDDMHQVLDSMESKWARVLFNARGEPVPAERVRKAFDVAVQMEEEQEEEERQRRERSQWLEGSGEKKWTDSRGGGGERAGEVLPPSSPSEADTPAQHRHAQRRREQQYQELTRLLASQSLLEIPLTAHTVGQDGNSDGNAFLGASSVSGGARGSGWPVVGGGGESGSGVGGSGTRGRMSATLFAASRRQQAAEALQRRTGHSMGEMLSTCMLHITAGLSDTHLVFAGQRVSPLLLAYGGGTRVVRQFHLPVLRPGSMNWQQRVRVLPPLAVLQALHRRAGREMPGILYEVIKNSPAFIGSTLELLWSATGSRHSSTGAPGSPSAQRSYLTLEGTTHNNNNSSSSSRSSSTSLSSHGSSNALSLTTGEGGGGLAERRGAAVGGASSSSSSYLLQQLSLKPYDAQSLFLELPLRNRLLCHPQHACHRLVQLLQLQLCSPNGYLTTLVDTTLEDAEMGLVMPHSHTFSQVHPFALFILFSHQAALPPPPSSSSSLTHAKKKGLHAHRQTADEAENEADDADPHAAVAPSGDNGSMSQQVLQAWAEVWAEYKETVQCMATTPRRKKEALRVLLHGALLLRAAALSRTEMNLNAAVPPYGFPLLASDIRVRPGRQHPSAATAAFGGLGLHQQKEQVLEICPASPDTVRRAAAAYKQFFAQAIPSHSHLAFRPVVGLNAGCDVVLVSGHTLYLYDIAISSYHLGQVIQRRFAEALLGILHLFETQILSRDRIHQVQYVTVVCCDQEEEPAYYRYGDVDGIMGNNAVAGTAARQDGSGRPLLSRSYQSLFTSSTYAGTSSAALGGGESDGEGIFRTSLSSEDSGSSSFALQRPDNVGAAVPLILDYSALLDDDTMDLLQYLRREVLQMGVKKDEKPSGALQGDAIGEGAADGRSAIASAAPPCTEEVFRTVQDLLDALEQQFRLPVRQRVLSTFEELEGLFSPTLLQLIPDSMLLPPFTPAVVSSEDLLQEVFQQQQEEENAIESDIGSGGGAVFMNATATATARQNGAEWEDVEQDHFLAQEQVAQGHPSSSSPENPFLADQELLESTELLEAMMNDGEEELEEVTSHRSAGMEEEDVGLDDRGKEVGEPPRGSTASASEAVAAAAGGGPPTASVTTPSPAAADNSFSWLQHAIPRVPPSAVGGGSPAFPFVADTGATDIAATAQQAPSPSVGEVGAPPPSPSLPFPYSTATPTATVAQAAQDVLFTGGYNTAALPTQDPLEEMDRGRREEGIRNGEARRPPTAMDSTAATLTHEGNDEEDWEEDEDMDEELEEGEDEGELPLHEKKSKTAGRTGREKKAGRATASGREGGRTKASVEESGDGGESELNALLRKSEGGAVLSTGERRRLRRLRRRRLAAAASGGKEQKLTVSTALRLRQQQKKGTGEKKSGVSSITGLTYDEEARFLERFLADERRRRQPLQRGRAVMPIRAEPVQRKGGSLEGSKKKKKKLLKKIIGKIGSKKGTSSGGSSSSSKSGKKVVRSSKPFPARRPVRRPKRLKRA